MKLCEINEPYFDAPTISNQEVHSGNVSAENKESGRGEEWLDSFHERQIALLEQNLNENTNIGAWNWWYLTPDA